MNRGVLKKAWRESAKIAVICAVAFMLFEIILARVFSTMGEQFMGQIMNVGFIRTLVQALLGTDPADFGPQALRAFSWVHPVILALSWVHAVTSCTRLPAGEVDRGTAEFLLTFPLSRGRLFVSYGFVFVMSATGIVSFGVLGHWLGAISIENAAPFSWMNTFSIAFNYLSLYLAVGCLSMFFSTLCRRRGNAIGWSIGLVLVSFFWSFAAQFWAPAKATAFLSLLYYYQPMSVLQTGMFPTRDVVILLVCSISLAVTAWQMLVRRDVKTT